MSTRPGAPQRARVFHLPDGSAEDAVAIPRLDLAGSGERHDENWLQSLVHAQPQILPAEEIEPAFDRLVPICRELPVGSGYVDNILLTPRGDLALVECKLWRNPQARREVVAQILDYAQALAGWSVETFERSAHRAAGAEGPATGWLHRLVSEADPEATDPSAFHDTLARNLRRGRMLLIVLGDGIREDAEALVGLLTAHAGIHFTLALVEAPVHRLPDGSRLVAPRVLVRTLNVERAVVRVEDGVPVVTATPDAAGTGSGRALSLSEETIRDALRAVDPKFPDRLDALAARAAGLDVAIEVATRSLVLRWRDDAGRKLNLATITSEGVVRTDYVGWDAERLAALNAAHGYLESLAQAVGGEVRRTRDPKYWNVRGPGGSPLALKTFLAHEGAWLEAARNLLAALPEAG